MPDSRVTLEQLPDEAHYDRVEVLAVCVADAEAHQCRMYGTHDNTGKYQEPKRKEEQLFQNGENIRHALRAAAIRLPFSTNNALAWCRKGPR